MNETLEIIKKNSWYNKNAQNIFYRAPKVDKIKSEPKTKESIADRVKLRRLFWSLLWLFKPRHYDRKIKKSKLWRNKNMVESINKKLTKLKNIVKNVPKDEISKVEENKKIIDIVERILELNSKKQLGVGLKILTPDQMLSRLPITLAQLKAGNNSEKLKNEIRQLYSLYRSKKLTKQLYKSLIDII